MSTATGTTTATSIPVVLAPGHLTKHLKVFLDKARWRDKAKLIIRYSQISSSDQSTAGSTSTTEQDTDTDKKEQPQHDLTQYVAMALLPTGPFSNHTSTSTNGHAIRSLWDLTQDESPSQPSLSSIVWPAQLSDPTLQKSIYLTHLYPSTFPTPKHLLAQTPLEKLQQSVSEFLLPYLQSWATASADQKQQGQGQRQGPEREREGEPRLTPDILPDLVASLPQKWEHYSDFTFLPPSAFLTGPWPAVLKRLVALDQAEQTASAASSARRGVDREDGIMARWEKLVQDALGSSHIARKAIIPVQDILRRPRIRPLAGDWKLHNRYKSWIEEGEEGEVGAGDVSRSSNLLEHQEMSSELSSSTASNVLSASGAGSGAESTGLYESTSTTISTSTSSENNTDVLPTPSNFQQTYWSSTCQNKVWYTWAPMFTMFSAGNITEKERVAHSRPLFDARDKVVVDLYAGIGYFALVYLVHAGARVVHACEWNPWSVEGLVRGAGRNDVAWKRYHGENIALKVNREGDASDLLQKQEQPFTTGHPTPRRPISTTTTTSATTTTKKQKPHGQLIVYPGDNAQWIKHFENTAHHVNLGLIPSAEPGWVLGVRALCPQKGGYLHVHHNIRVGEEEAFKSYLLQSLRDLFATWKKGPGEEEGGKWSIDIRHMENVKSFAPLVFHYVLDVECRPPPFSSTSSL